MDVIQKAHELADALAESPEVRRFREAEANLYNHEEAVAQYQALQNGQLDYQKIDDPHLSEYLQALVQFQNLLAAIKHILTSAYDGQTKKPAGCGQCRCCPPGSPH